MTPREVGLYFRAAVKRRIREHNDRAWLAHNTARLMHYHHAPKKMPSLRKLQLREPGRRQTAAEQLAIIKSMQAALDAVAESRKRRVKRKS